MWENMGVTRKQRVYREAFVQVGRVSVTETHKLRVHTVDGVAHDCMLVVPAYAVVVAVFQISMQQPAIRAACSAQTYLYVLVRH